jgi:hypothetical protein
MASSNITRHAEFLVRSNLQTRLGAEQNVIKSDELSELPRECPRAGTLTPQG